MGTYTTNYNLFMPSVGETGWGDLVNGNFTTIDTTMKRFDDVLSKMIWDGDNVTFPGKVAATDGTFGNTLTAKRFNGIARKSGVITVTPTSNTYYLPRATDGLSAFTLLPYQSAGTTYSGSINFSGNISGVRVYYGQNSTTTNPSSTYTFTNIPFLVVIMDASSYSASFSGFTLS